MQQQQQYRQADGRPPIGRPHPPQQQGAAARQQGTAPSPPPKSPAFLVSDVRLVRTGSLIGFCTVRIGKEPNAVLVHGWRLIQQPGQSAFISPPQESWEGEDGKKKYRNLFEFPRAWRQPLTDAITAAFEEHEAARGGPAQ